MARRAPAGRPLTAADPGFYGPGSLTWAVDREAYLILGAGPRALLMQVAHPAVAAGVDQHSDFRTDPWGRLAATIHSFLRVIYGTTAEARAEIRRVNGLHRAVTGELPGGGRYQARDPELSLWVHATLVDSTIVTADAWLRPLPRDERARLYAEALPVGRAFGIPASLLPRDLDAFEAYLGTMIGPGGPVRPGPLARELAGFVMAPPPGPAMRTVAAALGLEAVAPLADLVPPAVTSWLLWPSIGLLPPPIREAYGLPWGPVQQAVAAWLVSGWRTWNATLPPGARAMPQARAAERRMAASPGVAA